jgi:predicted GH43/DUF377 family glycosyl hydrolase
VREFGRNLAIWGVIAAILIAITLFPMSNVVRGGTWTLTSQNDFEAGTGLNMDTSSDPGSVMLVSNLTDWIKAKSNLVLDVGSTGTWDSFYVYEPSVLLVGGEYKLWYTGFDGSKGQIGYATSMDGLSWTREGSGPVLFPGSPGEWDESHVSAPSVLLNQTSGTYWMWYGGADSTPDPMVRIGLAFSQDGISWTKYDDPSTTTAPYSESDPVLNLGTGGNWDDYRVTDPHVLYDSDDGLFKMWFSGVTPWVSRLGYAFSADGISWTKSPSNPIMSPAGGWESLNLGSPSVLKDGSLFRMWYMGTTGVSPEIGLAESNDGVSWIRYGGNPVISGSTSFWDKEGIIGVFVMEDVGRLRMWYGGGGEGDPVKIGHATSQDGIDWTKRGANPALEGGPSGSWDENRAWDPFVLENLGEYMMWYSSETSNSIGYANSSDGVTWNKYPANPVLSPGAPGSWESVNVMNPSVLYENGIYRMWYYGNSGPGTGLIGYATSTDGITWDRPVVGLISFGGNTDNNIVLDQGSPGDFDAGGVYAPHVMKDGNLYKMWYTGWNGRGEIGYATSTDGLDWVKYSENPVLPVGSSGEWDDQNVWHPTVLKVDMQFFIWYGGVATGVSGGRIGSAVSNDGIDWTKNSLNPVLEGTSAETWDSLTVNFPSVITTSQGLLMYYAGIDNPTTMGWKLGFAVTGTVFASDGEYVSMVFDSDSLGTSWTSIIWDSDVPSGTNLAIEARAGDSAVVDQSWSTYVQVGSSGVDPGLARSKYIQFKAILSTSSEDTTPVLSEVTIEYTQNQVATPVPQSPQDGGVVKDIPTFEWTFSDPESDTQTGFLVQLDDDPTFNSPDVTSGEVESSNEFWILEDSLDEGEWYWRIRTRDSYDQWSDFTEPQMMVMKGDPSGGIDLWWILFPVLIAAIIIALVLARKALKPKEDASSTEEAGVESPPEERLQLDELSDEERLELLEKRRKEGSISEELYEKLRNRYE